MNLKKNITIEEMAVFINKYIKVRNNKLINNLIISYILVLISFILHLLLHEPSLVNHS